MKKMQSKTCIAVIKLKNGKALMAGDRRGSWDWGLARPLPHPKIIKIAGFLIGGTGDCTLLDLILANLALQIETDKDTIEDYMHNGFKSELTSLLKKHGYRDEHNLLRLQSDSSLELLVAKHGKLFSVIIQGGYNPDIVMEPSIIGVMETALPHAVGCGGASALPILIAHMDGKGYNKKEDLGLAMKVAAEISPGCDNNIDYIGE